MAAPLGSVKCMCSPGALIDRIGCPAQMTPTYQVTSDVEGDRKARVDKYTTMQLQHLSKVGVIKNSLPLDKIHHELEIASLKLALSGSSNIVICTLSFDCLMLDAEGREIREYVCFDLKIPGTGDGSGTVFSYDFVEKAYGGKVNLYAALKHFNEVGKSIANPTGHTHGVDVLYDTTKSTHDQYVRHTEQLLAAYLALPEASEMLHNRLRMQIRAKYPDVTRVKIYHMGLHMHSTKTCCAPCEYVLLGLANYNGLIAQRGKVRGFIANFTYHLGMTTDRISFSYPKKSLFKVITTVTATEGDSVHQKQPTYLKAGLAVREMPLPFYIPVKGPLSSKIIFTSMLDTHYDRRKLADESELGDYSVVISGSLATRGSAGTIAQVRSVRAKEGVMIKDIMARFAGLTHAAE